ncbi:hypothetical protein PR202_gb14874 [Eleusine coracana subsp. coracana]|uniref:(+)-neomenthol dehydrogenase-like n=1 Tax=Eleusine coracana subsp. coracana TaxID=191504 RepID=A0AAV5EWI1_ELECO|nr:hypothetical protein PR202_gb14874 [Eleusine coracana subsp. coracana]
MAAASVINLWAALYCSDEIFHIGSAATTYTKSEKVICSAPRAELLVHAQGRSRYVESRKHKQDCCGHRRNKGIGLEVCRQLASNGITVVLTARDEKRGTEAVEKLTRLGFSDVIYHQLDITDASSIAGLTEFLKSRFGRLDILVSFHQFPL